MLKLDEVTKTISLEDYGITSNQIHYQLSANQLHNKAISLNQGIESSTGALIIHTGEFTGRSPKDRSIVKDNVTKDLIWWGEINLWREYQASHRCHPGHQNHYVDYGVLAVRDFSTSFSWHLAQTLV